MTVINDNVPVFLVQVRLYINATFKISRSIRAFELTESGREISLPSGSFVKFQLPMDLRWLLHNTDAIYRSVFFLSFFFTFSNLIQDLSDTLHFYFKFLRKTKLIVIFFTASKLIKSLIQTDKFSFPRTFPHVSFLLPWNGYPVKQGRIIEKLVVTVISARSRHHQFFFHKKKNATKRHTTVPAFLLLLHQKIGLRHDTEYITVSEPSLYRTSTNDTAHLNTCSFLLRARFFPLFPFLSSFFSFLLLHASEAHVRDSATSINNDQSARDPAPLSPVPPLSACI